MSDDDLIRRGDALDRIEAKIRAQWTDATSASEKNDERRAERHRSAARVLERLAERIRALPAVAREPEAYRRLRPNVTLRCPSCWQPDHGSLACEVAVPADPRCWCKCRDKGVPRSAATCLCGCHPDPSPPTCATCGGLGVLRADGSHLIPGGDGASSGRTCPACAGGRMA